MAQRDLRGKREGCSKGKGKPGGPPSPSIRSFTYTSPFPHSLPQSSTEARFLYREFYDEFKFTTKRVFLSWFGDWGEREREGVGEMTARQTYSRPQACEWHTEDT